jgi:uncharacterized membrane protein
MFLCVCPSTFTEEKLLFNARTIPLLAFYTGLVAVSTLIFTVYIPATRGYFNIGESAVYIVALLGGPYIGAFAGGVGSMIADIILTYFFFAPATLVIKGVEGGILGLLAARKPRLKPRYWRLLSLIVGTILFSSVYLLGSTYYIGSSEISLGLPGFGASFTVSMTQEIWALIGLIIGALIVLISFVVRPEVGWLVLSAAVSGFFMVLGYYLYEEFVLGYVALAEVPFNVGQVLVGITIAIPVYNSLRALKRTK